MISAGTVFLMALMSTPALEHNEPPGEARSASNGLSLEASTGAEFLYLRNDGVELRGTGMSASLAARYVVSPRLAWVMTGRASVGQPTARVDGERVNLHPNAGYLATALLVGAELRDEHGWYARGLTGRSGFLYYSPTVAGRHTGGLALSGELGRRFEPLEWLHLTLAGSTRADWMSDGAWALFAAFEGRLEVAF